MAASVVGVGVRMVVDGCGAVVVDGGTTVVVTRRSGCGNVVVVVGAANVQPAPNITKTIPARPIRFTTNLHPDPVHWNKRSGLPDSSLSPLCMWNRARFFPLRFGSCPSPNLPPTAVSGCSLGPCCGLLSALSSAVHWFEPPILGLVAANRGPYVVARSFPVSVIITPSSR